MLHLGFVGLQISLPKKEKAIPMSFQISYGNCCISSFSTLLPSLSCRVKPIRGATLITCKSTIMSFGSLFISLKITLADFLPTPFRFVKPSKFVGIL